MIDKLTKKQTELLAVYQKKWYNQFHDLKFDEGKAKEFIDWMYSLVGKKPPIKIILDSPMAIQLAVNTLKLRKDSQLDSQLSSRLYSQLSSQLRSQLYSQLSSQLRSQLSSQLSSQLTSRLYSQLDSQLRSQLDSQLRSQLTSQLRSQLGSQLRSQLDSQLSSQLTSRLYSQLDSQLRSQLRSQLNSQLTSQLRSQLDSQLNSQLRSQLRSQLDSQLDSQLNSQLTSQLYSQLSSQLRSQNLEYISFDYFGDTSWFGYLCFYDFVYEELFKKTKIPVFEKYRDYSKSNINFLLTFEGIAFVSKPPVFINFDENNRLHCEHDYAVSYADGYALNFLHGVFVEPELFNKIKNNTVTGQEILALNNAELKAVIIQTLGYEKIFSSLKNKTLLQTHTENFNNEKGKPVMYELFDVDFGEFTARLLKVGWYEQKRFRETILGVPNNIDDIMEARAWTFGMNKEEYFNGDLKFRHGDVLVVYKNKQGGLKNEA